MAKKNAHINPAYKRQASIEYSLDESISGLEAGKFDVIAYLISKAESRLESDQGFIQELLLKTKPREAIRKIAVSGSPGVGKSSFIDSFGAYLCTQGKRIAVLPVDPSSQISRGSILGDKTRMTKLAQSEQAFIKPMSSSLSLGGLAPSTAVASMICCRAPFDYLIFETVGVGQSETEARNIADMFVLLLQPGGGDELQGIKRGIMEMADLFIITKADGSLLEDAENTARQIRQANALLLKNEYGWKPGVIRHSSVLGNSDEKVFEKIEDYYSFMNTISGIAKLRMSQEKTMFLNRSRDILLAHIFKNKELASRMEAMTQKIVSGEIKALQALQKLQDILDDIS